MNKTKLTVLDGGVFTTIQDLGRTGFRKYGVPVSGVMDSKSFDLANWLVSNKKNTPVLELTMIGGMYRFDSSVNIAITGAQMNPKINGIEVEMNKSISIEAGDELELGFTKRGCRAYLAVQGKLNIDKIMNSYSTFTIGKFGGLEGRTLAKGDELNWENEDELLEVREAPKDQIPYFSSKISVRIMKGLEWDWVEESVQQQFLNSKFEISSKSNRMGIRLEGESLKVKDRQMVSSPVIPGIIQLPSNGNPIILMQDGQTIGGYPRIAKVLNEELWRLGQLKPGDRIGFELID